MLQALVSLYWLALWRDALVWPQARSRPASGVGGRDAALLLPLTGSAATLGQNMARAASLVTQASAAGTAPKVYDTTDTVAGAAAAAQKAIAGGAKLLLGPLKSDQTPGVLAVAGKVPVITFSNDDTLGAQGAFVMGITPGQSVSTMFSYARAQGISRIAIVARDGPLGTATAQAANRIASAGGITLTATLLRDPAAGGLVAALKAAGGGRLPDAVFPARRWGQPEDFLGSVERQRRATVGIGAMGRWQCRK